MANAPIVVAEGDEEVEVEYDSDGYPIVPDKAKVRGRAGRGAGSPVCDLSCSLSLSLSLSLSPSCC